jgi:hypothetical protein
VSGDELRDAIAVTGSQPYSMTPCDADAILAMPEMQEIREFISRMANGPSPKMDRGRRQMEIWNLSESVIDWVLGGPS